jgi:hypothetical protein
MPALLEYHKAVRRSILASVAALSLLVGICTSRAQAQINGAPASVTSPGFGGHSTNAPRASVTSLGPNGYAPNSRVTFSAPSSSRHNSDHPHRRHYASGYAAYPYVIGVPVPYAADMANGDNDADDDSNYQGGPTIFDRHGSGADSYVPPVSDVSPAHGGQRADLDPPAPELPQEPTLLVFNDGRKLEVGNYAIVGATLFDLTPGHPRKVALADLDLDATRKQNDDRGVIFQLPASPQGN